MKRALFAAGVVLLVALGVSTSEDTLTLPDCMGEPVTLVLVPEDFADNFGPDVEMVRSVPGTATDLVLLGDAGHDVMRSLLADTNFITGPGKGDDGVQEGDTVCGTDGADQFYSGPAADKVRFGAGDDNFYGGGGADELYGGPGTDKFWIFRVEEGESARFVGGGGQDHFYEGRVFGQVFVRGGTAPEGTTGDHIHPCPLGDAIAPGVSSRGIEFVGDEFELGAVDPVDPCRYGPVLL